MLVTKRNEGLSDILILRSLSDNDAANDLPVNALTVTVFRKMLKPKEKMTPSSSLPKENTVASDVSVDQKLVLRVQQGDKKAFDLLVVKYQGRVASIISRYVKDHAEVADVTQEAFIKAYRAISRFRGDSAFYTWVYRIAINCAKNYLQAKNRRPPSADIDVSDAEHLSHSSHLKELASPESLLDKSQLETVINQAIMDLPEDLRNALTLREFDNLSYDEIAEVMHCPVGTVRSRIFRARESIDKAMNTMRSQ